VLLSAAAVETWRRKPSLIQRLSKKSWNPNRARAGIPSEVRLDDVVAMFEVLPMLLRGGVGAMQALTWIAARSSGDLSAALHETLRDVDFGESASDAMNRLGRRIGNSAGREFAQKLKIAMDRGNRLADMIESQADGLKGQLRAERIAESGKRENQMLLPLVFMVLPVTIAFAMYPSITALGELV